MGERVCRVDLDRHFGHASPTPNPFHQTNYKTGSPNTFINSRKVVRGDGVDKTYCTDKAQCRSATVKVNSIGVHRRYDCTSGHTSWVPNFALTGAPTVIAGG